MAMFDRLLGFALSLLLLGVSGLAHAELCDRIFFENIAASVHPYPQLEGVYKKMDVFRDNFPVFKHEKDNIYFRRARDGVRGFQYRLFIFSTSLEVSGYIGIAVGTRRGWDGNYRRMKGEYPFSDVFVRWVQKSPDTHEHFNFNNNFNDIRVKCVRDYFAKCDTDRVYMNESSTYTADNGSSIEWNNPQTDYFLRLPGVYSDSRYPVYQHTRGVSFKDTYLFSKDSVWYIGPDFNSPRGYFHATDNATQAEYITHPWYIYNGKKWTILPLTSIKCRSPFKTSCEYCENGGTCVSRDNQTFCECKFGFRGARCDDSRQCGRPGYIPHGRAWLRSRVIGEIMTIFCNAGYTPFATFSICDTAAKSPSSKPAWMGGIIRKCRALPTTIPPPTTRRTTRYYPPPPHKKEKFEAPTWTIPVVLVLAVLLHVALPFIHYFIADKKISNKYDKVNKAWLDSMTASHEARMAAIFAADKSEHAKREAEQKVKVKEEEQARLKKLEKETKQDASLVRILSMHMWVSLWLWIIYITTCSALECSHHGFVFVALNILGGVMIGICAIFLLFEMCFSNESKYIANILPSETSLNSYVTRLRETRPVIFHRIECYHWETRTRVVTYTDAQGNLQTRTETYQERVVTHTDCENFPFVYFKDLSPPTIDGISSNKLTRLQMFKEVRFGDSETLDAYDRMQTRLEDANRNLDTHMDSWMDFEVDGFIERLSAYSHSSQKSWWMNSSCYYISSLLCCTWPFRWLYKACTSKAKYTLTKKVYLREPPHTELPQANTVAIPIQPGVDKPIPDVPPPPYPYSH